MSDDLFSLRLQQVGVALYQGTASAWIILEAIATGGRAGF
jgi:hypothetical protein